MARGWEYIYELERLEAAAISAWWQGYADRLTPQERKRIRAGLYHAFWRPFQPGFTEGDRLEVAPRLAIRIDSVELRRGRWRCRIGHVWDNRPPHSDSPPGKRTFESLENVETIAGAEGRAGEPERVDPAIVANLDESRAARERYENTQAEARAEWDALPLAERVRRLELHGGHQARRQLRAIRAQVTAGEKRAGLRKAS